MPTRANETKRNIYAAEGVAGGAALAAISTNRVPEAANYVVGLKRKRDYRKIKAQSKKHVMDNRGRWVSPNKLSDESTKVFHPAPPNPDGSPKLRPDGSPAGNMKEEKSPRQAAINRTSEAVLSAKQRKKDLPFPKEPYRLEPKQGAKPDKKTGKVPQTKVKHEVIDGRRVKTAARLGETRRIKLLAIGIPAATAVMWHGGHQAVRQQRIMNERRRREQTIAKKANERDVGAAITGGTAGIAAYQAPSFAEWALRGRADKELKNSPKHRKIIENWKKKHKIRAGEQKGLPKWDEAYRDYPKKLPGAKMRRAMAYTHTGGSGRAAFMGVTALGAGTGVAMDRKFLRKKDK